MSKIIKCENGHFYDADKFASCPHCKVTGQEEKKAKNSSKVEDLDTMVTVAKYLFGGSKRFRKTPDVSGNIEKPPKEHLEKEITPEMRQVQKMARRQQSKDDDQLTVRYQLPESGLEPVVGWLVCVTGKNRGKDYRLKAGFNRIGRNPSMDVVLEGDLSVSRDNHCSIVYDKKSNQTFVTPGNGTLTYFKGEMVREAKQLCSGDEIDIGENKFVFIGFCEGERTWEEK